jgi:hypothetical protein
MKPYNGARRSMLKLGGKAMKVLDVLSTETKAALLGKELKLKKSSISVGLNAAEVPKTVIAATVKLGGQDAVNKSNEMREKYNGAVNAAKEKAEFVEGWKKENDDVFFVELKISTKDGKAQEHADRISPLLNEAMDMIPE